MLAIYLVRVATKANSIVFIFRDAFGDEQIIFGTASVGGNGGYTIR
jgi:hypothetical protein